MWARLTGLLDASLADPTRGDLFCSISFRSKRLISASCKRKPGYDRKAVNGAELIICFLWHFVGAILHCQYFASCNSFPFVLLMKIALISVSFDRKDDRGLRFWLGKPAIDWMQHIDLKERIIIWVAFDFPDLPYPDFGLLNILRNGRTGFRCSGAPPIRAGRPGAPGRLSDRSLGPQLCAARRSLPAGKILPLAHTNGSALRLVKHLRGFCNTRMSLPKCCLFPSIYLKAGCCCSSHKVAP